MKIINQASTFWGEVSISAVRALVTSGVMCHE